MKSGIFFWKGSLILCAKKETESRIIPRQEMSGLISMHYKQGQRPFLFPMKKADFTVNPMNTGDEEKGHIKSLKYIHS